MRVPMNMSMHFFFSFLLIMLFPNYVLCRQEVYVVDRFEIHEEIGPYDWRYIRVELPLWFSSTSLQLDSNFESLKDVKDGQTSQLPLICFRKDAPPIPDVSDILSDGTRLDHLPNASFSSIENLESAEKCNHVWKSMRINLTNEQIAPGTLVIGLFHGIGPIRTQAKMINRGSAFSFTLTVIVEGCKNRSMRGKYCNQTVEEVVCRNLESIKMDKNSNTGLATCNNISKDSCHHFLNPKMYSLAVVQLVEQLVISASNFRSNGTRLLRKDEINLKSYARYGVIPTQVNMSNELRGLCYSMEWEVIQCPEGRAGPNCTSEKHMLKLVQKYYSDAFFSYMPRHGDQRVELRNLPLQPLLTNASSRKESDFTWTFFVFEITQASSGESLHIDLTANSSIDIEVYVRVGGFPSIKDWDYFYINQTSNSDNGSMFKLYDSSERRMSAYLPYPREGLWSLGLRHRGNARPQTNFSLSVESCPNQCSDHGTCGWSTHEGYICFSCKCNARYGGFDCNYQLVSRAAHRMHVVFLAASNAAAIFPAVWALHQKAYADWVVFICSGVASAVYHACDSTRWCILPFHVLQFMDFWLSFVAVISTFIYLAVIDEAVRRTLQMIASIVTALLAINGPTKSANIVSVVALGASGLLVGWLIELFSSYKSNSLSLQIRWKPHHIRTWFPLILRALHKHFKWGFVLAGFLAVSLAAVSWNMEAIETYWLWHSAWHVSIYMSAFFFLCSRRTAAAVDHPNLAVEDATSPTGH